MREYIVVTPRVVGTPEIGYSTAYYSDMKRCPTLRSVIRHAQNDLYQSDDFLIGKLDGNQLIQLQWMDEVRDDIEELEDVAYQLCLSTPCLREAGR